MINEKCDIDKLQLKSIKTSPSFKHLLKTQLTNKHYSITNIYHPHILRTHCYITIQKWQLIGFEIAYHIIYYILWWYFFLFCHFANYLKISKTKDAYSLFFYFSILLKSLQSIINLILSFEFKGKISLIFDENLVS